MFGTGVDVVYPRDNAKLYEDIVARGGRAVGVSHVNAAKDIQLSAKKQDHKRHIQRRRGSRGAPSEAAR